tara:strand:+ start:1169 stop:1429 length:261 start_codon:yes stop_codon:yes gene_type:complete
MNLYFAGGASLVTSLIFSNTTPSVETTDILEVVIFTIPAINAHVDLGGAIALNAALMGSLLGWGAYRKRRKEAESGDINLKTKPIE